MTGHARRLGLILVAALGVGLSGCGLLPSANNDPTRLHRQAQDDLARWADAVAAGGQSSFVPVGELIAMVGDWGSADGNNNKLAMMSGMFEAAVPLPTDTPADGLVRWKDGTTATVRLISAQEALAGLKAAGSGSCKECVPLRITAARLTTGSVQTSRGPADAPLWEFTIQGTPALITWVAVAAPITAAAPTWNPDDQPIGIQIESATGSAAGRQLTVGLVGAGGSSDQPCGADYTAEAVESPLAIVVLVTEHPHISLGEACTMEGHYRTAEVQLAAPLGNRAVLEVRTGQPVPVTLTP